MRCLHILAAFLTCLCTTGHAQITSKIITASINEAKATARSPETKQIAANTDVTAGRTITANGRNVTVFGTGYNSATVRITGTNTRCTLETFGDNDTIVCAGTFSASISAQGDVVWTVTSAGGAVHGTLRVTSTFDSTKGVLLTGATSVDIGDDATNEFSSKTQYGTEVWSTPLRVDGAGTKIRVRSSAAAFSCSSHSSTRIVAEFLTTGGSVRTDAPACATGPALTALHSDWRPKSGPAVETLAFVPTALPTGALVAVYALGANSLQVPLPPSGCLVRNDVLVIVPVAVSSPSLAVTIPGVAKPAAAYVQFAAATRSTMGVDSWHTSDALFVQIQ